MAKYHKPSVCDSQSKPSRRLHIGCCSTWLARVCSRKYKRETLVCWFVVVSKLQRFQYYYNTGWLLVLVGMYTYSKASNSQSVFTKRHMRLNPLRRATHRQTHAALVSCDDLFFLVCLFVYSPFRVSCIITPYVLTQCWRWHWCRYTFDSRAAVDVNEINVYSSTIICEMFEIYLFIMHMNMNIEEEDWQTIWAVREAVCIIGVEQQHIVHRFRVHCGPFLVSCNFLVLNCQMKNNFRKLCFWAYADVTTSVEPKCEKETVSMNFERSLIKWLITNCKFCSWIIFLLL